MKKTDVCIIGAGPAGIFTALELLKQGSGEAYSDRGEGQAGGEAELSKGKDKGMCQLQALLQYYDRVLRGRSFF